MLYSNIGNVAQKMVVFCFNNFSILEKTCFFFRFIYNLVTKERYYDKPTYDTLRQSLIAMRDHAVVQGVHEICMPCIGCGLHKLDWNRVKGILTQLFGGGQVRIKVYSI